MSEQPQFIKKLSKQESPEKRSQLAQEISEKRASQFAAKNERARQESEAALLLKEIEALRNQVENYNTGSFLGKIKNFISIKRIEAELEEKTQAHTTFEQQLKSPIDGRTELQETQEMLADFYDREKQKWAEAPYSKEDMAKYFSEENLQSLSVEDYAVLLRRFPGNMVTHVTRQGIRDHYSMGNHTAGLGKFQDNFAKILETKRLHSSFGIKLQERSKEELVANFLDEYVKDLEGAGFKTSKEGAMTRIKAIFGYGSLIGSPYNFADSSAIHVATEEVADATYGGERGNEIFFAFPSAFVASQMNFGGQLKEADGGSHNDQRIWADLEKGMNLDAGIVFIPADAAVSAKTGSKYETSDNNQPIIIEKNVLALKKFVDSGDFSAFADKAMKITGRGEYAQDLKDIEQLRKTLEENFDIKDPALQNTAMKYSFLSDIKYAPDDDRRQIKIDGTIKEALMAKELLFAKANNPVNSKDYWETFFAQNPKKRPSKIVYYRGGNPTVALDNWRIKNKIGKRAKEEDIGFAENKKEDKEINKNAEQQRFMSIAKKLIDERFK